MSLLAGCGGGEEESEPAATPSNPVGATTETTQPTLPQGPVPARVRGAYAMRATEGDGLPFAGRWTLVIRASRYTS
ncbi:MAG: hypothetical protein M3304_05190 [Actinomycetota bacterium]|nr:hypothetical protein [Actinomycetota bacterium]